MRGHKAKYVNWFARKIFTAMELAVYSGGKGVFGNYLEEIHHHLNAQIGLMAPITTDGTP